MADRTKGIRIARPKGGDGRSKLSSKKVASIPRDIAQYVSDLSNRQKAGISAVLTGASAAGAVLAIRKYFNTLSQNYNGLDAQDALMPIAALSALMTILPTVAAYIRSKQSKQSKEIPKEHEGKSITFLRYSALFSAVSIGASAGSIYHSDQDVRWFFRQDEQSLEEFFDILFSARPAEMDETFPAEKFMAMLDAPSHT